MRSNSKLWMLAALFIMALVLVPVFAVAQVDDTTVTATADKQFVKPGDSFTVTFSLTNAADMYNYQIDLPLGLLVTASNEAAPWVEGSLFEGKATQSPQNYLDKANFPVPTAVLARSLQGDDFLTFTDTRVIGSITLNAGSNDDVFNIPLQNLTNQTEAENAIVRFDDKTLENKILYNAQPLDVIIDGTAPVINLDQTPEVVNEEQAGTNVVPISGTVQEANLDTVKVNGQLAALNGNGFTCNVSLADGDNAINVVAADKAGNSSSEQRNIKFIASKPAAPTADPVAGAYAGGVVVRLATTTPGAAIYYTTDGSTPTEGSTLYADKITITSNTTIKAIAVKDGKTSNIATFEYVIEPAGIGDNALNQLAQELVKLYNNMDASDKAALEAARTRINDPGVNWEQLLAPVLDNLTPEAKEALGPDPCASLRDFILDGLNIYYTPNTNVDQVAQQLKIFRSTYKPMITGVFDGGVTVEDIWSFILAVQDAVPGQFTEQDLTDLKDKGFDIIEERLQDWLNGAIDETLKKPEYKVFKEKLAGVGLTRDILIQTKDNLFNAAEPDLSAEQAVVKAYVRSRVELAGKTTLLAGNTETYQLKALGVDLASLLKWHSSDLTVAEFENDTSKLLAKKEGTTTVTAYWNTQDGLGLNKAWLKKFDVTVQPKEDVTPPTIITATHNAGSRWLGVGDTFDIRVITEPDAVVEYRIGDDGDWVNMPKDQVVGRYWKYKGTYTVSAGSPNGENVPVQVRATDQSDNSTSLKDPKANLLPVKIDTTAPNAPGIVIGNVNKADKTAEITLATANLDNLSGTKKVELYRWSWGQNNWVLLKSFSNVGGDITTTVNLRDGNNRFGAKAIDKAGNESQVASLDYTFDCSPPVFTVYLAYENEGKTVNVTVYASEDLKSGPDGSYKVVVPDTGVVLESGAFVLTETGTREYTGSFAINNPGNRLDITVSGTDENGNSGESIYTELVVLAAEGMDYEGNEVALLIPPETYFQLQDQLKDQANIGVGNHGGGKDQAGDKDLDVLAARQFRPDGTVFKDVYGEPKYVQISFNYDPAIDANKLVVYYYNPLTDEFEIWSNKEIVSWPQGVPGGFNYIPFKLGEDPPQGVLYIDPTTHRLYFWTDHFCIFGVAADTTPPWLALTSPGDGIIVHGKVTLSGNTEAGAAIAVKCNGTLVDQFNAGQDGGFTREISLVAQGENVIEVTAADQAGNVSAPVDRTVTNDVSVPELTVTQPAQDTVTTTESQLTVKGTTDADLVEIAVNGNPVNVTLTPADGKISFEATVQLAAGANTILIKATDTEKGTSTQRTITVTRQTPGGGGGGGGGAPAPTPGVGSEGGKVTGPAGKAVIEIPAGALDKKVVIIIKQVALADVTAPPATLKLAGDIYEFGPAGTKFAKPVTIIIQYDPAKLAGAKEETLAIYYLDETAKAWVSLGGTVDKTKHTVTITVDHFSKYAVMVETVAKPPVVKFKDVNATHWAWKNIEALVAREILKGYPDQTFRPENNITRAEFATIVVRALGLTEIRPAAPAFADVGPKDWFYSSVEAAAKAGLVRGYEDGAFRPENKISRQEMAVILVRALGKEGEAQAKATEKLAFADADKIATWAKGCVAIAAAEGLVKGYPDHTFGPLKNATRAETAAMAYRFLEKASK